jgi:hypothetical protein
VFLFFYTIHDPPPRPRLLTSKQLHQSSVLSLLLLCLSRFPRPPLVLSSLNGRKSSPPPLSLSGQLRGFSTGSFGGGGRLGGGSPSSKKWGGGSGNCNDHRLALDISLTGGFFSFLGCCELSDVCGIRLDRRPGLGVDDLQRTTLDISDIQEQRSGIEKGLTFLCISSSEILNDSDIVRGALPSEDAEDVDVNDDIVNVRSVGRDIRRFDK